MGVVKKQSIQNTVIQYLGIALGYFSSVILFTEILDIEQYGLTRVLFAIAGIYVNISSLGTFKIVVRFLPFFKTENGRHNGFLTFNLLFSLLGFLGVTAFYIILRDPITSQYQDSSKLFVENYFYVIMLAFLMLYTSLLENYLMAMRKTVFTNFLKSIFIRLIWILQIVLYYYKFYDFETFLFLYVSSYFVNLLIMVFYLYYLKEFQWSLEFFSQRKKILKVISNYGVFSIVSGISNLLVNRIDIIMITFLLGLSATSVYQIAFYISSIIFVPSQAIARISMPIVAKQWKEKNLIGMKELYQKSSLNQLVTGGIVFLMVWVNIDDLYTFLKPEYADGKWAVLLLSLSVLFNMVTGINQVIIVITKYFRYDTYASIALAILTILTNLTFIPLFGINGAAFATLISIVMYHTFKNMLILVKLKMQPFTMNTLWAIVLIVSCYLVTSQIPNFTSNLIVMILVKCAVISILYLGTLHLTGISSDIQSEISSYLAKIKKLMGIS